MSSVTTPWTQPFNSKLYNWIWSGSGGASASNSYLNRGLFSVSPVHWRQNLFHSPSRTSLCLPALVQSSYNVQQGTRFMNTASQIMESSLDTTGSKELPHMLTYSSSYETAMEALSSLITRQNRKDRSPIGGKFSKLERMMMYIKILGLEGDIDNLKIIHVAGTKGKGSTCTFCESILRESGFRTGLFTSPHLVDVRERFRLNGLEISQEKFLEYFWDCWNQLKAGVNKDLPMPPLFQFLTVLAFKIFIAEKVDVAVVEVGLGGMTDSTNVIKEPVVCGITSLGMDHTETLGDTIDKIASHKAGIFKPQIPAFTVSQPSEAMAVIQARANELQIPLEVASPLDPTILKGVKLGLSGDHQFINAGLAVSLTKRWLLNTGNWDKLFPHNKPNESELPEAFLRGLSTAHISGRAQIVQDRFIGLNSPAASHNSSPELTFYLDGAHSPESMEACASWFCDAVNESNNLQHSPITCQNGNLKELSRNGCIEQNLENTEESNSSRKLVLLFNCMDVRDPHVLLQKLVSTCSDSGTHFSKALFVPSMSSYNKVTSANSGIPSLAERKDLTWQFNLQKIWEKIIHGKGAVHDKFPTMAHPENLPPPSFLYDKVPESFPADKGFSTSAVMPSLPLTIKWLRDCVRENPSVRVQVLVTGSLHLVGDVLKLLR
ncbi:unnamed protein product [Rhodiola kirilowii]